MPRKDAPTYVGLKERAAKGEFTLVEPLDYLLLEMLPEEGELVMGLYPLAKTVDQLRKEKLSPLTPGQVSGQIRSLSAQGLVIMVRTRSHTTSRAYQRTELGKKVYEEWKANQTPDKSGGNGKS